MTIEEQLKQEILSKYKSVNAFTSAIDIPNSTLNSIFNRGISNAGVNTMLKIFDALNLDIESIQTGKLSPNITKKAPSLSDEALMIAGRYQVLDLIGKGAITALLDYEEQRILNSRQTIEVSDKLIPFRLSTQSASAGKGTYLGPEEFETIMVEDNALTRQASFGVPVSGDSMEPTYHDGDILLVKGVEVAIGEIGIFTLDGDGYVKQRGERELLSLNPAYEPIPLNETIRCNGKVIGVLERSRML